MKTLSIDVRDSEYKERSKKARVYIFIKNENIMENLENRRNRPCDQYRKEVMPGVLKEMGLPDNTKFSWKQDAGCRCGCSPGFIIDKVYGKEVFVDITK